MSQPWDAILDRLPLTRSEQELVVRFRADPDGRTFLPIADIFRGYDLIDESLELLTQGVARYPDFTVARVVLARELYNKGLIPQAWSTLKGSPTPLRDNVLAQKLLSRIAILLQLQTETRHTLDHMIAQGMMDPQTQELHDHIALNGFQFARDHLLKIMRDRGVDPVIPQELPEEVTQVATTVMTPLAGRGHGDEASAHSFTAGEGATSFALDDTQLMFHVIPLDEVFRGVHDKDGPSRRSGVELDTLTMADIYATQGLYQKALGIYKRLLRLAPHNDMLKKKVQELIRLEKSQKDSDLSIDPTVVDRMEQVEIVDRQVAFYNALLEKIR